jgi:hypothetical protein
VLTFVPDSPRVQAAAEGYPARSQKA